MNDLYNDYREDSDEYASIDRLTFLADYVRDLSSSPDTVKCNHPAYNYPSEYRHLMSRWGWYKASYCNSVLYLVLRACILNYWECFHRALSICIMDRIMEKDSIV